MPRLYPCPPHQGSMRSVSRLVASGFTVAALGISSMSVLQFMAPAAHAAGVEPVTGLTANRTPADPVHTFRWDRTASAKSYRIQISASSSFSSTLANDTTTNVAWTPTERLPDGTLHARVRAEVSNSVVGDWNTIDFATEAVPAPELATDQDDAVAQLPQDPAVMRWRPVAGAISYTVEVDEGTVSSVDWVNGKTGTSPGTSLVWPTPQGVGDYTWRVRAVFPKNYTSAWSESFSYNVPELPNVTSASCAPTVACAPEPGSSSPRPSVTLTDVALDWDPIPGAQRYEVRISTTTTGSSLTEPIQTVDSTRYAPATTYKNDDYFWQVRPVNAALNPAPWPAQWNRFTRRWTEAPQLVYPQGTVADPGNPIDGDQYFQWTPVARAAEYQLDVGTDPNFTPGTFKTCFTDQTTYTAGKAGDPCYAPEGAVRFWRVTAVDQPSGQISLRSTIGRVVYNSGSVEQLAPLAGDTVSVPTLSWKPSRHGQTYRVELFEGNNTSPSQSVVTSALSWTPTSKLAPGQYWWRVAAIDGNGAQTLWPLFQPPFTLTGPLPSSGAALTPTAGNNPNDATTRVPQLSWVPLANATTYRLMASVEPGIWLNESASPALTASLAYPTITPWDLGLRRTGVVSWKVEAYDAQGAWMATGPVGQFRIKDLATVENTAVGLDGLSLDQGAVCSDPVTPTNPVPACQAMPSTPVLDWDPVAGAGGYLVYLSNDPDLSNLHASLATPQATLNTRLVVQTALPDNESGQSYYWHIRPCLSMKPIAGCAPDPTGQMDISNDAFRKVSPAVTLTSPVTETTYSDEITLAWEDYRDTAAVTTGPSGGGRVSTSQQSARGYEVQTSATAQFTSPTVNVVDQPYFTSKTLYAQGARYWKVRAIDGNNNTLPWSEARKLTRRTPTVNLDPTPPGVDMVERVAESETAPQFGANITSAQGLLRWKGVDFDASWKIEVYKDNDTTASAANRVISSTTQSTAFSVETRLAPSTQPYRWRVQRVDSNKLVAPWSDYGSFMSSERNIDLYLPTDGSDEAPNGPTFSWHPLSDAVNYQLFVSPVSIGATPAFTSPKTVATTWSTKTNLATGTYEWFVRAYDAGTNTYAVSSTRTFRVNSALTAVTGASISAPEGASAGRTLTGAMPTWSPGPSSMVTNTFRWLADGRAITGAILDTYTVQPSDFGKKIQLEVSGNRSGYVKGISLSNELLVTAGGALVASAPPKVTGASRPGETLRATTGTWSATRPRLRYQWTRNGAVIPGATGSSYRLQPTDAGTRVMVRVYASSLGLSEGMSTSNTMTIAKNLSTTRLTASASKTTQRAKVTLTVSVSVPGLSRATGKVTIKDGKKTLKALTLNSKSQAAFSTKKLRKGTHKLKVFYTGTSTINSSASAVVKVIIVKR